MHGWQRGLQGTADKTIKPLADCHPSDQYKTIDFFRIRKFGLTVFFCQTSTLLDSTQDRTGAHRADTNRETQAQRAT